MTKNKYILTCVAGLLFSCAAFAATAVQPAIPAPTPAPEVAKVVAEPIDVEALMREARVVDPSNLGAEDVARVMSNYGWIISQQSGLATLELTPDEVVNVVEGLRLGLSGEKPSNIEQEAQIVSAYLQSRMSKIQQKLASENAEAQVAFFADLGDDVLATPSGLRYTIIEPGEGEVPTHENLVTVDYTGALLDGTVFDSSVKAGAPVTLPLTTVIPGFREGIQLLAPGGKIKLYIPSELAYGVQGAPNIAPGSALVFDIELLSVTDAPEASEAPGSPIDIQQIPGGTVTVTPAQ
jgi:FKBP-type peptidyl-prolyl cis-trans isomerase